MNISEMVYTAACQYVESIVECEMSEGEERRADNFDISVSDIPGIIDALTVENIEIEE